MQKSPSINRDIAREACPFEHELLKKGKQKRMKVERIITILREKKKKKRT